MSDQRTGRAAALVEPLVLWERIDVEMLRQLHQLDLPQSIMEPIEALYGVWGKVKDKQRLPVQYNCVEEPFVMKAQSPSFQALPAGLRCALGWRHYHHIELRNEHWTPEAFQAARAVLAQFFEQEGYEVGALHRQASKGLYIERKERLCFEGILTREEPAFVTATWLPQDVLDRAGKLMQKIFTENTEVFEKTTLMKKETLDRILYTGTRVLHKLSKKEVIPCILAENAQRLRLRRQGTMVYEPHATLPKVFVPLKNGLCDAQRWISQQLVRRPALGLYSMKDLLEWFQTIDCVRFPIIRPESRFVGFSNCVLDLEHVIPRAYDDPVVGDSVVTVFFDQDFNEASQRAHTPGGTPLWDSLLEAQLTPEQKRVFECLFGRLQYQVGQYDNWQVCPIVWGDGGTGKSAVCKCARATFDPATVGTIGTTQEKTFGLQSLRRMRSIIVGDLPANMHQTLGMQDFQIMCGAEPLSAATKNGEAWNGIWTATMMLFGNRLPAYEDQNNSISRRLVSFRFVKKISPDKKDTKLADKIIAEELGAVLIRCLINYRLTAMRLGDRDFWATVGGPEFEHQQEETLSINSPLDMFLVEGDSQVRCRKEDGVYFPWSVFVKEYRNYIDRRKRENLSHDIDKTKLNARDFIVREIQMCSNCGQQATNEHCKCKKLRKRRPLLMIRNLAMDQWTTRSPGITGTQQMQWLPIQVRAHPDLMGGNASDLDRLAEENEQARFVETKKKTRRHKRKMAQLTQEINKDIAENWGRKMPTKLLQGFGVVYPGQEKEEESVRVVPPVYPM